MLHSVLADLCVFRRTWCCSWTWESSAGSWCTDGAQDLHRHYHCILGHRGLWTGDRFTGSKNGTLELGFQRTECSTGMPWQPFWCEWERRADLPTYSSLYSSSTWVSTTKRCLSERKYGCTEVPYSTSDHSFSLPGNKHRCHMSILTSTENL